MKAIKIHLLRGKGNLLDYFKQGQLELGALAVSAGSTFRTDIPCLKTERQMMLIGK